MSDSCTSLVLPKYYAKIPSKHTRLLRFPPLIPSSPTLPLSPFYSLYPVPPSLYCTCILLVLSPIFYLVLFCLACSLLYSLFLFCLQREQPSLLPCAFFVACVFLTQNFSQKRHNPLFPFPLSVSGATFNCLSCY